MIRQPIWLLSLGALLAFTLLKIIWPMLRSGHSIPIWEEAPLVLLALWILSIGFADAAGALKEEWQEIKDSLSRFKRKSRYR